jgi:prolyl-tRNA synthetase
VHLSTLLGKTLRQPPSDTRAPALISYQLLVRAAFVRAASAGRLAYLPLGLRAIRRQESLVRSHLARLNGQEVAFPSASLRTGPAVPETEDPAELIRQVSREVDSHRQLPVVLYQQGTIPVRRPSFRTGLFGTSERPAIEIHAFGRAEMADVESRIAAALDWVFTACGLEAAWAGAGSEGYRAQFTHPSGDEAWVDCPFCDYAAVRSWATTIWPKPPDEAELPRKEIATPECNTISALADFLDIPATKTLKMVFYSVEGKVTCVVIRGDRAVDEVKLARMLGTHRYYSSLEDELAAIGAVGGFASPIGLIPGRIHVVADLSVRSGANYVSGANRADFHIQNVNIPRDFVPETWTDLALIETGDPCPRCGAPLEVKWAFELARSTPPAQLEAHYLDEEGRAQPLWWASWRLDLGRLLAAVVEIHHDEYGILWPIGCAPFAVHLIALDLRREAIAKQAEVLYDRLWSEDLAVLYDDRDVSAGVKFNDADLIGIPLRLTISKRSAADGLIEVKWRDSLERFRVDDDGLAAELSRLRGIRYREERGQA